MRRRLLVIVVVVASAGASAATSACSSDDASAPAPVPDAGEAAPPDAGPEAAPPTLCTMTDIPVGTGTKFCDLPGADVTGFELASDFCIREFATVPEARVMKFAPNGDLFVAAPSMPTVGGATGGPGAIIVLPDDDHDGRADSVTTFASATSADAAVTTVTTCADVETDPTNLACVHGLLFAGNYVYFTRSDEVRRLPYAPGDRKATSAQSELVTTLGEKTIKDARWTHTLERTKDGAIYVSRGRFDSDECSVEQMSRGGVYALHVDPGTTLPVMPDLVADGFRNPMYLRCSPSSCGECYASELSGDDWDNVGGHEKLALLEPGKSWGYPCCVTVDSPLPDAGTTCGDLGRELVAIPLHDTNFGLDFDRGGFPDPYRHGLFVALHGVFTSFGGTGVIWMATDPSSVRPTDKPHMFLKGFQGGRATDVVFAPDGRLFVADDTNGKIYWIAPRTLAAPK